jgi:acetyl esterase/lipase
MASLPWPLPREPPALVRRLVQLITLPPTLFGIVLSLPFNTVDYLLRRPPYPFKRHLILGALRFLQNASSALRFVMPLDAEADVVPKAAAKRDTTEYAVRMVPPIPEEARLPVTRLTPGMEAVETVEVPMFAIAPKGAEAWKKAAPGELCILYIVGGGYQVGHPLRFPMTTGYVEHTGLRLFSPNYRKCLDDASGYPAPLLDMVAGLQFVVDELGFEPKVSYYRPRVS